MTPCCANLHMSVPLPVLTLRTSLYECIYSQVHIYQGSYHGYFGISTRAVHSHTCWCPCECSHLEPLCIHIVTIIIFKYTYIVSWLVSWIVLYMNPCCANSQMFVPLRVLALGTSSYSHVCSQVNIFHILQILLYMTPCCANSRMSVKLQVLTLRTSLYTCMYLQVYMYHIRDTFVYEPMLCELTYVSSLASAHTLRLKTSLYTYILTCKVDMTIDLMCAGKWRGPHSWLL